MTTRMFEEIVNKHSLCPNNMIYNSNALAGESGEVANVVKKITMATLKPEWVLQSDNSLQSVSYWRNELGIELSDQLFYLARLALDNELTIKDLMNIQAFKLREQSDRYKRTFLK